jgi:hypothetical protein
VRHALVAAGLSTLIAASAFANAKLTVRSLDAPNVGLNDSTPTDPVGGNNGRTLGEQRMIALQFAADMWGNLIDSNVEILIDARFQSLTPCDSSSGVLAQAGPVQWLTNFDNAPKQDIWYPIALANKFAKRDLSPDSADIAASFNLDVDNSTCLGNTNWYYGLDDKHGANIDMVTVALHEFAHGLGVAGTYNSRTGALLQGKPNIFEFHTLDDTAGLRWDQMTDAQRMTSQTNDQNLVWDGAESRSRALALLGPTAFLRTNGTNLNVGRANFGSPITIAGFTGSVVAAVDDANDAGPSTTDGCTAFTNPASVVGRIALIDRGTCPFVVKARNAQNAGAIGAIIVDNVVAGSPNALGGSDPSINIVVVSLTKNDGDAMRAQLPSGLSVLIGADPLRLSGADGSGFVKLYAPSTFSGGSSVHHWDPSASPNLLMEPSINSDLTHGVDITVDQLVDMGWTEPNTGRRRLRHP